MSWTSQSKKERLTLGIIIPKSVRHLTFMKRKPLPHLIKFLQLKEVYKLFTAGQIVIRLFHVIRVSMGEISWYSRPTECESHHWYQWVKSLVCHSLVSESHLVVVLITAAAVWGARTRRRNVWATSLCWWRPITSQADKNKTLSQVKSSVIDKQYRITVLSDGQIFTKHVKTNNLLKTRVLFRFSLNVFQLPAGKIIAFRYV
jgi:hypothetical protein